MEQVRRRGLASIVVTSLQRVAIIACAQVSGDGVARFGASVAGEGVSPSGTYAPTLQIRAP